MFGRYSGDLAGLYKPWRTRYRQAFSKPELDENGEQFKARCSRFSITRLTTTAVFKNSRNSIVRLIKLFDTVQVIFPFLLLVFRYPTKHVKHSLINRDNTWIGTDMEYLFEYLTR